jgi:hypothetical protein
VPTPDEVKGASKFIKAETKLLASAAPEQVVPKISSPELDAQATASLTLATAKNPEPGAMQIDLAPKDISAATTTAVATNSAPVVADAGGNGGFRGGGNGAYRPRRYLGPGSASDVTVGKLAPGIAQPKVFHQALPEKPITPQEGALALFTQALFASAEFRYLQ